MRHLINDSPSNTPGKNTVSATTSLESPSFNSTTQNFSNILSPNTQLNTSNNNTSTNLINNDIDNVMVAWKRQMELSPITLPPRNIQTLSPNVFISYDFIYWLMRTVNNLDVLEEALAFAERLVIKIFFY